MTFLIEFNLDFFLFGGLYAFMFFFLLFVCLFPNLRRLHVKARKIAPQVAVNSAILNCL